MYNCIYSGHCFEQDQCDNACPVLAQTSYLLERNGIQMNSEVFHSDPEVLKKYINISEKAKGKVCSVIDKNSTTHAADMLTYCNICTNWQGSQLHCTVYNLKFSQYLDMLQKSWNSSGSSPDIDYIKIWISTAKVLIISSIDFVNFRDFQCQTILSLIQSRSNPDLTTIIVSPPVSQLVGEGPFFARLTDIVSKQKVV